MRALINREIVARVRIDDELGNLTDADTPPTVSVTDGAGNPVAGVSAVTKDAVTDDANGVYKAIIPAQTQLDVLTVSWSASVGGNARVVQDTINVVGDRLVPLWRLREDSEINGLTPKVLLRLQDTLEDWFGQALHFPTVEESLRIRFNFNGGRRMYIPYAPFPKSIIAITEGASPPLNADDLADLQIIENALEWKFAGLMDPVYGYGIQTRWWLPGPKLVYITHGPPWARVPEDIVRAAISFARYISRPSNYPERASQVSTEGAIISFATPDPDTPTGIADVDMAIREHRLDKIL